MINRRKSAWTTTVALAAMIVLVVQMAFGLALAEPAMAGPGLDEFGNPLCITHLQDAQHSDHKGTSKPTDCCTQACNMFASLLAPSPFANFILNRLERSSQPYAAEAGEWLFQRPELSPGNPRAPPSRA